MDIVKFTKDNSYQRIKAWYIDENSVTLSEKDEKLKDRLMHIWSLRINNKYTQHQIIQIIVRDYKVSHATAYRNYPLAMHLFGDLDQVNIAAERMIFREKFENLYQMALKKGNEDAAVRALTQAKSLYDFQDTTQKVDPKKLEASNYIIKLPRNVTKLLTKTLSGDGVLDFNSLGADDVDFKAVELEDEEEDE
ncbi:hypothetical protein [Chishuiella sp.]|uniref:hypothetical protein n=1 Tax=Chishuiella sp. TaxID=1969467 RepID=UPI0028B090B7|nr:hypothetical protein [Chishuiella sp.]